MAVRYAPNTCAGKYTIKRLINTGNFAISYEAVDEHGRKVFLKQYKSPSLLVSWYANYKEHQLDLTNRVNGDSQLRERTYEFIDMYEHKNAFIQVYEFIEGGKDLKEYLKEEGLSPAQRFTFASLLLYTLNLFHGKGIVHTDLKPDNVYLMPKPKTRMGYNLKLIDFDFTVLDDKKAPWDRDLAKDGQNYCGTPRYMSPEHLRGEVPRAKSDVFTAAIICYELLTKNGHPFPEDDQEYKDAVLDGKCPSPEFIVPRKAPLIEFGELLQKALSPNLSDRPTVEELHRSLLKSRPLFIVGDAPPIPKPPEPKKGNPSKQLQPSSSKPTEKSKTIDKPKSGSMIPSKPSSSKGPLVKLGLSMKSGSDIDWFKTTSRFGKHTSVSFVREALAVCDGHQFTLERDGENWYIEPAPVKTKNMVVYNGEELLDRNQLSDGDIIAFGSRKSASLRNVAPMVVHLEK